jgi:hypothetical protein
VCGKLVLNGIGPIHCLAVGGAGIAVVQENFCSDDVEAGHPYSALHAVEPAHGSHSTPRFHVEPHDRDIGGIGIEPLNH